MRGDDGVRGGEVEDGGVVGFVGEDVDRWFGRVVCLAGWFASSGHFCGFVTWVGRMSGLVGGW